MDKVLYFLLKPTKRLKLCIIDVMILVAALTMNTSYALIGRIALGIQLIIMYFGYTVLKESFKDEQRLTIKSTMVVITLLLIYLMLRG